MSDLASLIAQLSGNTQQPVADPAMAAVKLARASIDALVLKLGQTVDAKVVGQLAAGLTQLSAGSESFVLKLETPLPSGAAVTIKVAATPQGAPSVTVSVPGATPQLVPMPVATPTAPLIEAQATRPAPATPQALPLPTRPPLAAQAGPPAVLLPPVRPGPAPPQPSPTSAVATVQFQANGAQPLHTAAPAAVPPQSVQPASISPAPAISIPANTLPTVSSTPQVVPVLSDPSIPTRPAGQAPFSVAPEAIAPARQAVTTTAARSLSPVIQTLTAQTPSDVPAAIPVIITRAQPSTVPLQTAGPASPMAPTAAASPPAPLLSPSPVAQPPQPQVQQPFPYPVHLPRAAMPTVAEELPSSASPMAATPRPLAPLNLTDPAQAAARQDSVAPLLARLVTIVTAAAPSLPRPIIEIALKLLANRIDLNRGAPDAGLLEAAVHRAGVLLTPPTREAPADAKSALLALRTTLLAFLGGDPAAPVTPAERPAPPIKGEPPRAPAPQVAVADPAADGHETARALLGHTDAALSRLKLLQSASQPVDLRIEAPAPRNELRVEVPMMLGAETGILQLMVERDGKRKRDPERQRGWRMRFAMHFSQTGEVGADVAMLGRSASIAIWAADPEVADALDQMLPELAPAIQRHGLELTSLRVRRSAPQPVRPAPGQLLDSAR